MLEDCRSLSECERILSNKMQGARYIAQIELSRQDLELIERGIFNSINSIGIEKTQTRLRYWFPFCTAFFMVYKGIWEYRAGNYWSSLLPVLNVSDPVSQSGWGEWFLHFLKAHNLVEFKNVERTYRYVTPILLHGGIPQACIEGFFEKVIIPLIEQGYTDSEQVVDFLYSYRIREHEKLKVQERISSLQAQISQLEDEKAYVQGIIQCLRKFDIFSKTPNQNVDKFSLEEIKEIYEKKDYQLESLKKEIKELEIKHKTWERVCCRLEEIKRKCHEMDKSISKLKDYLDYLDKTRIEMQRMGSRSINWRLSNKASISLRYYINRKRARRLILNRALIKNINSVERLNSTLRSLFNNILMTILLLEKQFGFQTGYEKAVQETALSLDTSNITRKTVGMWRDLLENTLYWYNKAFIKGKEISEGLKDKVIKRKNEISELDVTLNQMGDLLRGLGEGYLDNGFYKMVQWVSGQGDIYPEKISEIASLKQDLKENEKRLRGLSCFVQYADGAVQHFLLYGGDWAKDWLVAGVGLVCEAMEGKLKPYSEAQYPILPERCFDVISNWWEKHLKSSVKRRLSHSLNRSGQYLSVPVLSLDLVFGELKIVIGPQRVLIPEGIASSHLFVKIEEGNNDSKSVTMPLRSYRIRGEDLIETQGLEYELQCVASSYKISLGIGDELYKSWELQGIDEDTPFVLFSLDGIHVPYNQCPKCKSWVLMREGYEFKTDIPILEEISPPALPQGFQLVLVDFTGVDRFAVENSLPYLIDTSYIQGLSISGAPVCTGRLPKIAVPLSPQGGLEGWNMLVRRGKASRRYFRLSGLNNIHINHDNGYAEIDLMENGILHDTFIGFYSIYLRNPIGAETNFQFTIMPDLIVDFEPTLHFPSDKSEKACVTLIFPPEASFIAEPPAAVLDITDEAYEIEVPWGADRLSGEVAISFEGEEERFRLNLELPNIKWRIQGLTQSIDNSWHIFGEEVWMGDWENWDGASLCISVPSIFNNPCICYYEAGISDCNHCVRGRFTGNKAVINLGQFADTIINSSRKLSFYIKLFDSMYKLAGQGVLFNIRNWWQASNLQYEVTGKDDGVNIKMWWDDLGKASDRVVQLWRCWEPWEAPLKYSIPDGAGFLEIQEDYSCLKEGRYLVRFDTEGPWDQPVSPVFPSALDETHFININGINPWIGECGICDNPAGSRMIKGRIFGANEGNRIEGFLVGLSKGDPVIWKGDSITKGDGDFSIPIPDEVLIEKWAHWLVINGIDIPVHYVYIIPDAPPLEVEICGNTPKGIVQPDMVSYVIIIQDDYNKEAFKLGGKKSEEILGLCICKEGDTEIPIVRCGKLEKFKIVFEKDEYFLMIQNGVKCTGCGAVLENQSIWDQEHYPRCKSFIVRYTEKMKVSVIACIDNRPLLKKLQNMYTAAGTAPLELYSNAHNPIPGWRKRMECCTEDPGEWRNMVLNWAEYEMNRLKISTGSEGPNER